MLDAKETRLHLVLLFFLYQSLQRRLGLLFPNEGDKPLPHS